MLSSAEDLPNGNTHFCVWDHWLSVPRTLGCNLLQCLEILDCPLLKLNKLSVLVAAIVVIDRLLKFYKVTRLIALIDCENGKEAACPSHPPSFSCGRGSPNL